MKEIGIYVHIPFCIKKCDYCDFVSYCNQTEDIDKYISALKQELIEKLKKEEYCINTIYIGGGTPSSIDSKYIIEIMNTIKSVQTLSNEVEITIELNPGTVTKQKLEDYQKAGINRLSIGLQETHNRLLKQIGRIHTYEEFAGTYQMARAIGFQNINVDLMIGLPDQRIQDIKENLENIIRFNPEHISVYSLILEEGTKLYIKYEKEEIELPDEELERNMYWYVKNTLENNGYNHYEISNFAKSGYESKHNLDCWSQKEYLGFGVAAHSYLNGIRYSNTSDLKKYIETDMKEWEIIKTIHEEQIEENMKKEYMLLGLRKIEGVSIQKFKNKFTENPIFLFRKELSKLVTEELLQIDGDYIRLTNKGLDLANLVWEEFV